MYPFFNSQQNMQQHNPPVVQNPMQFQQNMPMMNPQVPNPFMNHGAMQHQMGPNFANSVNNLVPFQNNHLGMQQFRPGQQPQLGFSPQGANAPNNVNAGNVFANIPRGNLGFPNGQLLGQNSMPNVNQVLPMQMSNPAQVGSFGVNQMGQEVGNQTPGFFGNPQLGMLQPNQLAQNMVLAALGGNLLTASGVVGQQGQGHWPAPPSSGFVGAQQSQNLQSPGIMSLQRNQNPNQNKFTNKNFNRNSNGEASREGFRKPQFHHAKNAKRKFGSFSDHSQKGFGKQKSGKFGPANSTNQAQERKRSLSVIYTEQEIQKWREERKRNYPSKANTEKKLSGKLTDTEIAEREAKSRREQLKEILAKQAELGVEVAEIPSHYLSDSEKVHGNVSHLAKKGKFRNEHDKRGRHDKRERFAKKRSLENKRKPTLLEKLLSADIRRDRNHLLQVFRFMVMNSFFKDWPEKSLRFPEVIVKENGLEGNTGDERNVSVPGDFPEDNVKKSMQEFC